MVSKPFGDHTRMNRFYCQKCGSLTSAADRQRRRMIYGHTPVPQPSPTYRAPDKMRNY